MADTEFSANVHPTLVRTAYARKALLWAQQQMFFKPFIQDQKTNEVRSTGREMAVTAVSDGSDAIITRKSELVSKPGDKVQVRVVSPLSGQGTIDDETLEGSEEALVYYTQDVTVRQRRNAVRDKGQLNLQRVDVPFREDAKGALGSWLAQELDSDVLLSLCGLANTAGTLSANAPSGNRRWVGGQTTAGVVGHCAAETDVLLGSGTGSKTYVDHLFGTKVISTVKRKATMGGVGYPRLRPIMIKGKAYYIMMIHTWQAKALRLEAAWIAAQSDANNRGLDNPIFDGSLGVFDGVVVHEWDKIEARVGDGTGTDPATYFESGDALTSSSETACRALFLGAQAGLLAIAKNVTWKEKSFDYENKHGIAIGAMWGAAKTEFNSEDFAVIAVDTCVVPD